MFDFNRVEITGIVIISIIVMVVMWFLTDLSGTDRLINTVIAGVVAAIAASISLLVAHQFDIDVWR